MVGVLFLSDVILNVCWVNLAEFEVTEYVHPTIAGLTENICSTANTSVSKIFFMLSIGSKALLLMVFINNVRTTVILCFYKPPPIQH